MNKQIEALKMAIEAMNDAGFFIDGDVGYPIFFEKAIKACKEALAEAEKQEIGEAEIQQMLKEIEWCHQELAKKEWQSLCDGEIGKVLDDLDIGAAHTDWMINFAYAIEDKLKEKNFDSLSS